MRTRRQVILDSQFGRDIEWLRYEFRPAALGTRGTVFVPVTVVAPNAAQVTVLIWAANLYILGFSNDHGEFHLSDHPSAPDEYSLCYSSHYQSLGLFDKQGDITLKQIIGAVTALANARSVDDANQLRFHVGIMALIVPEALRKDIVAGLLESLISGRYHRLGISRQTMSQYVRNYGKQSAAGDPYVEIPL